MRLWQDSRRTESGGSKELQALVAKQLDALTTNKLIWQGELWPGIATEIEVRPRLEEQIPLPPGAATVPEQPTDWDLKVSLSMETLGPVILLCKVTGSSLQLEVRAASQTAADRIAAAVNTLKSKFQTTGFQQVRVKVVVEE
ncbi:flagellar hook-length control protein FliK [Microbulbifer elongatus]|uniref:flagellar hook-length control protein FliK n=1 Tax=Microbulbifer elongatus TaxID=86173 RepID=UPI001E628C4E|nr:flagellar hook-length control protein FliK [Microbulbifer elongatus]